MIMATIRWRGGGRGNSKNSEMIYCVSRLLCQLGRLSWTRSGARTRKQQNWSLYRVFSRSVVATLGGRQTCVIRACGVAESKPETRQPGFFPGHLPLTVYHGWAIKRYDDTYDDGALMPW